MKRAQDIGTLFAQLVLIATLTGATPQPFHPNLTQPIHPTSRCMTVDAPEAGRYWVTLSTQKPSTAPSLLVLATHGPDPQPMHRIEATLFEVEEPGEHIVCLSSPSIVGQVEVAFAKEVDPNKGGDPKEVEVEEDP